jgi:diacylglycerol kinase family enzyme
LRLPRNVSALARISAFAPARPVWPGELLAPGGGAPWRFLLMAGVGFDAEVVEHLDVALKRRIGKGAYVAGSLVRLARYQPCRYPALLDGAAVAPASLVVARAHYYGGRFVLAPAARLDKRGLHAVLFERPTRFAMLRYMAAVVMGRLGCQCDVKVLSAERIELHGPAGAPVQVDGDIRAHLPLSVGLAATPLNIIAAA